MAIILSGITILVLMVALIIFVQSQVATGKIPPSVPWAGVRGGVFSKTRACIRELTAGVRTVKIGYDQFNRKGLPCVIPDPGFRPVVLIPPEHLSWLCDQSEHVLSAMNVEVERRAIDILFPSADIGRSKFMIPVIQKELNRRLGKMHPAIFEETRNAVDITMGRDTDDWKEVCIKNCVEAGIYRSILRIFVGPHLCKNEEFVSYLIGFANWFGGTSILVAYMPRLLKAFFGNLGALPVYYYRQKAFKVLLPLVSDRMANLKRMRDNPSFKFEAPDDLVTWAVQAWIANPETAADRPEILADYMLILSIVAIPTTVMTATNAMLDLVSSDSDANFWGQLGEEASGLFKNEDDWTNPTLLPKLSRADSTIREGLRKNPLIIRSVGREVVADDGVTLPSGHLIPKGVWMGAGAFAIHHDDRFYHKPEEYDPFRFVKKQSDGLTESEKEALVETASIYRKNEALVMLSDIFVSFGLGKHACPGRWLAAHQLKLMFAYMSASYEIQGMGPRPANWVFGDALIPSSTATMIVRRRKHT